MKTSNSCREKGILAVGWLWYVAVGVLGGVVGGALAIAMGRLSLGGASPTWGLIGVLGTVTGVLAAILGILSAAVVAFQWLVFDRRVDERVRVHRAALEAELQTFVRQRVQTIGELAISISRPIEARERVARRVLALNPDLPNVAPMMAWGYLMSMPPPGSILTDVEEGERDHFLDRADHWAQEALTTAAWHDAGYPEWVAALVAAWRKEPWTCARLLQVARAQLQFTPEEVLDSDYLWPVLTNATNGERELGALDSILQLLDHSRPTWDDVHEHCSKVDALGYGRFWAIDRQTGGTGLLAVRQRQKHLLNGPMVWSLEWSADTETGETFESVMQFLETRVIPTRLVRGLILRPDDESPVPDLYPLHPPHDL
jgi:hypothetical protein